MESVPCPALVQTVLPQAPFPRGKKIPRGCFASLRTIELVPQPADLQSEGGFICLHLGGRPGLKHLVGGTQEREPKVQNLKPHRTRDSCDSPRISDLHPHALPKLRATHFSQRFKALCRDGLAALAAEASEASSLSPCFCSASVSCSFRIVKRKVCCRVMMDPCRPKETTNNERKRANVWDTWS